jgi:hypothetical protein
VKKGGRTVRAITHPNQAAFQHKFDQVRQTMSVENWDYEMHPKTSAADILVVRDPKTGYVIEVHTWAPVT